MSTFETQVREGLVIQIKDQLHILRNLHGSMRALGQTETQQSRELESSISELETQLEEVQAEAPQPEPV